ncbi:hypothetical protein K438DRAFT_1824855 [Mycena galopus ATCC 62051]|nr:hypothetical protein K438DRAFT_1824855 [Mycena galopus ATCC 62051]
MNIDLLRNRAPGAALGPFDGKVAALAQLGPEHYFITTHADYVPALTSLQRPQALFLRSDTRYGTDDPTLWPQEFSAQYCHLAAIPKRGSRPELEVMWWDPSPEYFVVGSAITRGVGCLRSNKLSQFLPPVNDLVDRCTNLKGTSSQFNPLFGQLINSMLAWIEQLQTLPTTYKDMVFYVTSLQRTFLELEALYKYTTKYKPCMDNYYAARVPASTPVAKCVRAFTTNPVIAQQLWVANLPVWFIRPTHIFAEENILTTVPLVEPISIALDALDEGAYPVMYSGDSTVEKMVAISRGAMLDPWYRQAFNGFTRSSSATPIASRSRPDITQSGGSRPSTLVQKPQERRSQSNKQRQCSAPYSKPPPKPAMQNIYKKPAPNTNQPPQRDKFCPLAIPEMPPTIAAWANALMGVDRSVRSSAKHGAPYVLPEPALLGHSERRAMFLHHWNLLADGFLFMLGQPMLPQFLSGQEWRDVLEGLLMPRGIEGSRTNTRSKALADRIQPALEASNITAIEGLPIPSTEVPKYNLERTHETVWKVAETNFRFEFAALDRLASGMDRLDEVKRCFAGGMLNARLMLCWNTTSPLPPVIRNVATKTHWSPSDMQALEVAVCQHYTQSFWELLGRAAVIPMRLDHHIEKEDGEL